MARLALALAVVLIATPVWGQDHDPSSGGRFHVVWDPRGGIAGTIKGHVYNGSVLRLTNVRLEAEGLAADHHSVGKKLIWAVGDIVPGGEAYFVVEAMPDAVTYRVDVVSFDIVSRGVEAP